MKIQGTGAHSASQKTGETVSREEIFDKLLDSASAKRSRLDFSILKKISRSGPLVQSAALDAIASHVEESPVDKINGS